MWMKSSNVYRLWWGLLARGFRFRGRLRGSRLFLVAKPFKFGLQFLDRIGLFFLLSAQIDIGVGEFADLQTKVIDGLCRVCCRSVGLYCLLPRYGWCDLGAR